MSREAIIDLITREVMSVVTKKAQGTDATAQAASAPAATLSPVAALAARAEGGGAGGDAHGVPRARAGGVNAPTAGGVDLGANPLLIVCGNALGKDETTQLFGRLKERHPRIEAVMSPSALAQFGDARRAFAGRTLDPTDRDFKARLTLHSSAVVINTSVNLVAKVALLIADSGPTIAVFEMLRATRPVYLVQDPLLPWYVNGGIAGRISGYLATLGEYGIRVLNGADLIRAGSTAVSHAGTRPTKDTECHTCGWAGHCASLCSDRVSAFTERGTVRVAASPGIERPHNGVAAMIDHTLLKADATSEDVEKLCEEARKHNFASVCVNPGWVRRCKALLSGSNVKVATVIGFPLGATTAGAKEAEAHDSIAAGADELDMVVNVGALKGGDYGRVLDDIKAVVRASQGKVVKVILETALLTDDEKVKACELAVDAGAQFVKTSTGFGPGGATVHDVELMRRVVGPHLGVKASGGVRDYETAMKMVKAGADRLGTSASVAIVMRKPSAGGSPGQGGGGGAGGGGYDTSPPKPAGGSGSAGAASQAASPAKSGNPGPAQAHKSHT